ncbi:conserved hypothetical Ustilaginaceae-specific protein [Sporisorium reilianum SRZ2]|uniref:Conserved hypothetical Ustilaginaceae-specific protein n=1 Tax=Sporisorium reilianum (strain SRZ2) TaxID=999809 RepID=E6ZLY4_SPORE|nr:conserved hypothetical Ustilaginaceae-specific protein [Sporisorium reilianum SRZ2]
MKITKSAVAVALAILASTVSGHWLDSSSGPSWNDYCTPGAAKVRDGHACFTAHPWLLFKLIQTDFQGYLGPHTADEASFAVTFAPQSQAELWTDKYALLISTGESTKKGEFCFRLLVYTYSKHGGKLSGFRLKGEDQQCGAEAIALPRYLWE